PVLVSLTVKREPLVASIKNKNGINEMFAFWDPRQSIWITNDTYNRYNDSELILEICDSSGKKFGSKKIKINIVPDSSEIIWKPSRFEKGIKLNSILNAGDYLLTMQVFDCKSKLLSYNYFNFKLTDAVNSI
nr:hypothetical protein [Candidatus Dependentiae bacterium]